MIKKGDLVEHVPLNFGWPASKTPSYGLGIVVESWEDQAVYPGVPQHDPDDLMVMFEKTTRMIKRSRCRLVEKCPEKRK